MSGILGGEASQGRNPSSRFDLRVRRLLPRRNWAAITSGVNGGCLTFCYRRNFRTLIEARHHSDVDENTWSLRSDRMTYVSVSSFLINWKPNIYEVVFFII